MFYNCYSLINIDFSNFNSQKITNISHMLYNCKSLKNINLSNFYTKNVTNMYGTFCGRESLTNIDLSYIGMGYKFSNCYSLTN